jgi:hypothetical protein
MHTISFTLEYMHANALPARVQGEPGGLALVVLALVIYRLSLFLSPLAP